MAGHRWGPEGPPPDAYERVTNAGRFAPLHRVAEDLLDTLERDFDARRSTGYGLDTELERSFTLARPTIRLVPERADAAPLAIAFSTFPGLHVRFGRWSTRAFPQCGCDACDETAEEEAEELAWLIGNVIAGRFREAISTSPTGTTWGEWESWSDTARSSQKSELPADVARRVLAEAGAGSHSWQPWPVRAK